MRPSRGVQKTSLQPCVQVADSKWMDCPENSSTNTLVSEPGKLILQVIGKKGQQSHGVIRTEGILLHPPPLNRRPGRGARAGQASEAGAGVGARG
jgi:hypothetical protein